MGLIILAPHPDDEWIGCGCTILKKIDAGEKVKVLIITQLPKTNKRIRVSKRLSKKYEYSLFILGEPERKIDPRRCKKFLNKHITRHDEVYIPDYDTHPDHQMINRVAKKIFKKKQLIEYAVYNNSQNMYIRLKNKLLSLLTNKGYASFRTGRTGKKINYKLKEKNSNIIKFFEKPRSGDCFRMVK